MFLDALQEIIGQAPEGFEPLFYVISAVFAFFVLYLVWMLLVTVFSWIVGRY